MNDSKAIIIAKNGDALRVAASAARISTQQGTALEIYESSLGDGRDLKLIGKVLSSGHKSVIEHQTLSIAFNNVSVLVEQFVIEARLASYTVKSRRYVDFSGAGFVTPFRLNDDQRGLYDGAMRAAFADYDALMALGVPKEDARFVLPYCLRSNFFMTVNARELIGLICAMIGGRGRCFAEIEALGAQLKEQFDGIYPGVIDAELARMPEYAPPKLPDAVKGGVERAADAELIDCPRNAMGLLKQALAFSGRFAERNGKVDLLPLMTDARPRELEVLQYSFRVSDISLACLTHFTRHRMQSILIPPVVEALARGNYVLPESVAARPEAERIYRNAFARQADIAREALKAGFSVEELSYFAMSGHLTDILLTMNARELMHFMKLRTCERAQWEIRGAARRMLELLLADAPEIFRYYGPSCLLARCPEGRMSCGRPKTMGEEARHGEV